MAEATTSSAVQSVLPFGQAQKQTRKSYSRDDKLKIIDYYKANGRNFYKTCKFYDINSKNLYRWLKDGEKIKASKRGSRRVKFDRRAEFPEMEQKLHSEFRELRSKGLKLNMGDGPQEERFKLCQIANIPSLFLLPMALLMTLLMFQQFGFEVHHLDLTSANVLLS